MCKKCSKCGEVKELSEFYADKDSKDKKKSRCKTCCKEEDRNRKYELTCQNPNCGVNFIHCRKVKYCPECTPKRMLEKRLASGRKNCVKCGVEKDFSEFHRSKWEADGRISHCKICIAKYSKNASSIGYAKNLDAVYSL